MTTTPVMRCRHGPFAAPAGVVRGDSLDARSESHPDLPTQAMNECSFDMPSEGL